MLDDEEETVTVRVVAVLEFRVRLSESVSGPSATFAWVNADEQTAAAEKMARNRRTENARRREMHVITVISIKQDACALEAVRRIPAR